LARKKNAVIAFTGGALVAMPLAGLRKN